MEILFLGLLFDKNKEKEILQNSRKGLQNAVNSYQWNLIKGFEKIECNVTLFNTIPIGCFPNNYKKLIIKSRDWQFKEINCKEIGFVNLPIIKQIDRKRKYLKQIIRWIKDTIGEKTIIAYSLYLPYLKIFKTIKKRFPSVHLNLIVTDLPCQYGILPSNPIKAFLLNQYGKKTLRFSKSADSFVLLTEQMRYPLELGDKPYCVIEGICDKENICELSRNFSEKKIILYTGTLDVQFGIKDLLEAFSLIESKNYELWLAGAGNFEAEIKRIQIIDKRIKFFGYVQKNEVIELQSKATLLINPRRNDGEYTKYSFPSKTMEYMVSGIPVLMYKLDGIPNEYDDYLYYVDGNTIIDLKESIVKICEKSNQELIDFGEKAKQFVANSKNSIIICEKVKNFLENNLQ